MAKDSTGGSATPATVALAQAGIPYALHAYHHDDRRDDYGDEAADAWGGTGTTVQDVGGGGRRRTVVAVVPVSGTVDLKALAAAVRQEGRHGRTGNAGNGSPGTTWVESPPGAARGTAHRAGHHRHDVRIDPGVGRAPGLDLEIMPDHLITVVNARTAPIARPAGRSDRGRSGLVVDLRPSRLRFFQAELKASRRSAHLVGVQERGRFALLIATRRSFTAIHA